MDEIGVLKDSFNKMIERINDLVISEYQARDQLQKTEISEQKMAMLYLKQQINPHFLYNTLDMIRLKAAINQDKEVSEMLMELVKFYRLSTRVHLSMVTVQKEVEMLGSLCEADVLPLFEPEIPGRHFKGRYGNGNSEFYSAAVD